MDVSARIAELEEQLAELRELIQVDRAAEPTVPRRHLLRTAAGATAAVLTGGVLAAQPAGAATGDALLLGKENETDAITTLRETGRSTYALVVDQAGIFIPQAPAEGLYVRSATLGVLAGGGVAGGLFASDKGVGITALADDATCAVLSPSVEGRPDPDSPSTHLRLPPSNALSSGPTDAGDLMMVADSATRASLW